MTCSASHYYCKGHSCEQLFTKFNDTEWVYNREPERRRVTSLRLWSMATTGLLTISVLQAYCGVITVYGIPSNFVRKSTASLTSIKISTAQLNFSNRNIIF